MSRRLNECCCVVNQHCEAPANLEPMVTPRTKCADCEQRVCIGLGCSIRTCYDPAGGVNDLGFRLLRIR